MDLDPTPDHYKALGLDKSATAAIIKSTYRKLVLKCHPDKVTDPALKEQKQEEFHRIQQAYECLIDDEKRAHYHALLDLDKLRKEKAARQAAAPRDRTARFDVSTPGGSSFTPNGPTRYATEYRAPQSSRDDAGRYQERERERERERSHHQTYTSKPTAPPRSSREKESSKSSRYAKEDRGRSEREKARAKEVRSDRKFASAESESSADEKARHESGYKIRTEEDARRKAAEERRSYEEARHTTLPTHRKMSVQAEEALRYQHKSRAQVEEEITSSRPMPARASSRDYYAAEPRSSRRESSRAEAPVRRSSARPNKDRPSMSRRETDRTDRGIPEVVDWADERRTEERRPPMFKHSTSSPIELGRGIPQRSYTERLPRRTETSPPPVPPAFHRSSTMPIHPSSSRRKESTAPRSSGLRETTTSEQYVNPERDNFSTIPPVQQTTPSSTKKVYYYPVSGGGVSVRPDEIPTAARHVPREPSRYQRSPSPSPIGKPPIGANRPVEPTTSYKTAPRPSMPSRNESYRTVSPVRGSEDRGRSGRPKLYGEIGRQPSFDPNDVQFSRRYGPEDVRWAPRSGEPDKGYSTKPSLGRTATYVY